MTRRFLFIVAALVVLFSLISCTSIYFNTFHNIRKNFNAAEKTRENSGRDQARGAEIGQYNTAITKASKVLERHPNSSWVDDALYVIGASYYYLGEFGNANRKFKELFANYPESPFVPEARLLYAKSKLNLKEEAEAIVVFEEIFEKDTEFKRKANAARALGQYYFEAGDYDQANIYFYSLIDSLGSETDKLRAYMYLGDGYYGSNQFHKAYDNYTKALDHGPDTLQTYEINYKLAWSDYFLNRVLDGINRLEKMASDDQYYDSLGAIRLALARGYEWDGDMDAAIESYERITEGSPKTDAAAVAYYELGLIYQYDFENLDEARQYYNKSLDEKRKSSVFEDATRRATRLEDLQTYTEQQNIEIPADSIVLLTQADVDTLARTRYLLGELFYFDLEKPDSAIHSYEILLEKFPTSKYAPRALISMAYIYRDVRADTSMYYNLLRRVLTDYSRYDEAETAINILGLAGTRADSGYAAIYYHTAEDFYGRFKFLDSSDYYFRLAADSALRADSARRADSIRVADSLAVLDSIRAEAGIEPEELEAIDSLEAADLLLSTDSMAQDSTVVDSLPAEDSVLIVDSVWVYDSTWLVDSLWVMLGSALPDPNLKIDTILRVDTAWVFDTVAITLRETQYDTTWQEDSSFVVDTITAAKPGMKIDSTRKTVTVIELDTTYLEVPEKIDLDDLAEITETSDSIEVLAIDSVPVTDSIPAADSIIDDKGISALDSITAENEDDETVDSVFSVDSIITGDTTVVSDSAFAVDSALADDSYLATDSMIATDSSLMVQSPDSETTEADTLGTTDTIPAAASLLPSVSDLVDTGPVHRIDTLNFDDSLLIIDSLLVLDSALTVQRRYVTESELARIADSAAADSVREINLDLYWETALAQAHERFSDTLMTLLDSALYYYQYVIDTFPLSQFSIQARYARLFIYDKNLMPGDSSMIDMYMTFVDSFPYSEYTGAIAKKYRIVPSNAKAVPSILNQQQNQDEEENEEGDEDNQELYASDEGETDTTAIPTSAESRFITDSDGNIMEPVDEYYLREDIAFEYPIIAAGYGIEGKFYFHIRIDFNGDVVEAILMNPSREQEFNERLTRTVESTKFDAGRMDAELYDKLVYYTKEVYIPSNLK